MLTSVSAAEPPRLIGRAAGWCADVAEPNYEGRRAAQPRAKRGRSKLSAAAPLPEDAIQAATCLKCGMPMRTGRHASLEQCIAALRDRLADLE
jgi:uncharacterized paraquat-inducible protein A